MELGLYIHIPFCKKRCNYCDFYTAGGKSEVSEEYVNALIREIKRHQPFNCKTVYFGGGTPSLLSPVQVGEILSQLDINIGAEITLEANPETLTQEKLDGYFAKGINRLSIGVQTAKDENLKSLGRIHDADKAKAAFQMAKKAGLTNISGDIMLGLDNYSYKELDDTINLLNDCGATHISAYMLKIEKGTHFYKNTPENLSSEEQLTDFYLYACDKLKTLGFEQYEISNFAKNGYYSRHNNIYWQLGNYLGIGPSAHSCINGQRFYYPRDRDGFIEVGSTIREGYAGVDVDDYIMLSLRLKEGLSLDILKEKWKKQLTPKQLINLKRLEENGFLTLKNNCISLTPKGFLVENSIACEIMV